MPGATARTRVNLTVESKTLEDARALGLNLSKAAEDGMRRAIRETEAQRWKRDNADAFAAHNARIEREGTLLVPEWAASPPGEN